MTTIAQFGAYGTALKIAKGVTLENAAAVYQLGFAFAQMTPQQIASTAITKGMSRAVLEEILVVNDLNQDLIMSALAHYDASTAVGTYASTTGTATMATGGLTATIRGLWATISVHPIGALITLFAAVTAAVIFFKKKHEQAIQESIKKAEELQEAYQNTFSELDQDTSTLKNLSTEFAVLSKGVANDGRNMSLTSDEYDRYLELVEQIVAINPALVQGYDAEGNAIIDKNTAIQSTIDLLKEQRSLELANATSSDNNWSIAEGLSNAYDQAVDNVKSKQVDLGRAVEQALLTNTSYFDKQGNALLDPLINGVSRTEVYRQLSSLFEDFGGYETLVANGAAVTDIQWMMLMQHMASATEDTGAVIAENIGLINSFVDGASAEAAQILTALTQWKAASRQAQTAASAYQSHMKIIAQASTGYDELTVGAKTFLNTWIETQELTGEETEETVRQITTNIQSMVSLLSAGVDVGGISGEDINVLFGIDWEHLGGNWLAEQKAKMEALLSKLIELGYITVEEAGAIKIGLGIQIVDPITGNPVDAHEYYRQQVSDLLSGSEWEYDDNDIASLSVSTLAAFTKLNKADYGSFEEMAQAAYNIANGLDKATQAAAAFTQQIEGIKNYEDAYAQLSEALGEFAEKGYISAETIAELMEAFGDTAALRNLIVVLGQEDATLAQVQEALNTLGSEYLETSDILSQLDESTADWATQVLQANGVTNAAEVVLTTLQRKQIEATISSQGLTNAIKEQALALGTTIEKLGMTVDATRLYNRVLSIRSFMDKVQENPHTDAAQKAEALAILQAQLDGITAQFNALPSLWEGLGNINVLPSSSSSSSKDSWLEAFEAEYAEKKHLVEMEKMTLEDFYTWLDGANKKYFANNSKYLDEYRKYAEEVFNGLRDLLNDDLSDGEHQIFLWENEGDQEDKIIEKYRELQSEVGGAIKNVAAAMRDAGWSEAEIANSDIIQELQKKWWEYEDAIHDVVDTINEDLHDSLESLLELTKDMIKQEKENEKEALESQVDAYHEIIDLRKEMLQLAERERSYNEEVAEKAEEIAELEQRAASLRRAANSGDRAAALELGSVLEQIGERQKELGDIQHEHAIESTEARLDEEATKFEQEQQKKIDAIDAFLENNELLHQAATDRLSVMNQLLFDDLLTYAKHYTETTRAELESMWADAQEAAAKYGSYVAALNSTDAGSVTVTTVHTPTYHTGTASAGGSPTLKQNELFAKIQQGEMILNQPQQSNLWAMLSQLAPVQSLLNMLSSRSKVAAPTAESVVHHIDASLHIEGSLPDDQMLETLRRHERKVANMLIKYFK